MSVAAVSRSFLHCGTLLHLLHVDGAHMNSTPVSLNPATAAFPPPPNLNSTPVAVKLKSDTVVTNTAINLKSSSLLMTCRVLVPLRVTR